MLEHAGSREGEQMKIKYDSPDVGWCREETHNLYARLNTCMCDDGTVRKLVICMST